MDASAGSILDSNVVQGDLEDYGKSGQSCQWGIATT